MLLFQPYASEVEDDYPQDNGNAQLCNEPGNGKHYGDQREDNEYKRYKRNNQQNFTHGVSFMILENSDVHLL
jgi:hypothetical protein